VVGVASVRRRLPQHSSPHLYSVRRCPKWDSHVSTRPQLTRAAPDDRPGRRNPTPRLPCAPAVRHLSTIAIRKALSMIDSNDYGLWSPSPQRDTASAAGDRSIRLDPSGLLSDDFYSRHRAPRVDARLSCTARGEEHDTVKGRHDEQKSIARRRGRPCTSDAPLQSQCPRRTGGSTAGSS